METAPLIDYYTKVSKLIEVDGEGDVAQVQGRIAAVISGELATRTK